MKNEKGLRSGPQALLGPEFAHNLKIDYEPSMDEIAAMGRYTMIYHIADNFRDGEFRSEILKLCGIEEHG